MFEERLVEFSRERLGGRPLPDDLRTMLVAEWQGRAEFRDLLGITFLEAGKPHPFLDAGHRGADADPETRAIDAALAEMSGHLGIVAQSDKGWIGYWLHPDEPADRPPPLIQLDTEGSYWSMVGSTLAEACAADRARYHDEPDERVAFTLIADRLAELGLPLGTRDYDALRDPEYAVNPEKLTDELIEAECRRRGLA
ncbi:hypothetical protein GCM10009678_49520 [Actinomadura kijaniata]|uniref:Uncharacterized protein n=1 Tax=Actinomadura namibiensis TaxID=182080 RepID=A0A7W3LNT8_ACTNM|nr:hypothetical protein [Actinomadura namibiensis]MBA8951571.1 hypothetical protein [Actinomadura namibiensis]